MLNVYSVVVGDVEVVCSVQDSSLGKEKGARRRAQLHVGGIGGMSCQHLQVLMTRLLSETLGVARGPKKNAWHCSEQRPAMHLYSMDIKTAVDVARPNNIAIFWSSRSSRMDYSGIVTSNGWVGRPGDLREGGQHLPFHPLGER